MMMVNVEDFCEKSFEFTSSRLSTLSGIETDMCSHNTTALKIPKLEDVIPYTS